MNWFNARDLAQAGTPIRRLPWTDKWITYWRGLWWCHIRDTAPRVVRTTDFGKPEFLAEDWTTIAPERVDCPPVIPPVIPPPWWGWPILPPGPGPGPIVPPVDPIHITPITITHPKGFTIYCSAECAAELIVVSVLASVSDANTGDRWMVSIRGPGTRAGGSGFVGPGEDILATFSLNAAADGGKTFPYTANFSELDHPGGSATCTIELPTCEPECHPYSCFESPSGGYYGECAATPYCEQTVTNPFSTPVTVQITGSVDDELLINGAAVDAGCCIFLTCNGAHAVNHVFSLAGSASFTMAAGDNHGGNSGYYVKVCFNPVAPPP